MNLTLQNLPKHFDNPEFRRDALRAIGSSVNHIQELIARLTLFRQKIEIHRAPVDLNASVQKVIDSLKCSSAPISIQLTASRHVLADAEQIEKVVTNLVLNALDSISNEGKVEISTFEQNGDVLLCVADNGCGMPPEFISGSLFRPFKTTKKGGIGIGMFQSKTIIDAHKGRIEVDSQPGKGTTFRVSLPAAGAQ